MERWGETHIRLAGSRLGGHVRRVWTAPQRAGLTVEVPGEVALIALRRLSARLKSAKM